MDRKQCSHFLFSSGLASGCGGFVVARRCRQDNKLKFNREFAYSTHSTHKYISPTITRSRVFRTLIYLDCGKKKKKERRSTTTTSATNTADKMEMWGWQCVRLKISSKIMAGKMKRMMMMMMKKKPLRKFIDFTYKFNSLFPHHWLPPSLKCGSFQPALVRGLFSSYLKKLSGSWSSVIGLKCRCCGRKIGIFLFL